MADKVKTAPKEETALNPMKRMRTVFLPSEGAKGGNSLFVGLNGKGYNIMRGMPVQVPEPVAQIVQEKVRLENKGRAYYDGLVANTDAAALK